MTGLIPVLGSTIIDNPKHPYEKKNVFKITYADSKTDLYLAARSDIEKKQWIYALNKVQVDSDDGRSTERRTPGWSFRCQDRFAGGLSSRGGLEAIFQQPAQSGGQSS